MTLTGLEIIELIDINAEKVCENPRGGCPNEVKWLHVAPCCAREFHICTPHKDALLNVVAEIAPVRCRYCGTGGMTLDDFIRTTRRI